MAYSPKSIANYFLSLAKANGDSISPMKLQKLIYYAHGWYAGHTGAPLIDESIEAWQYGPVIPSIYHEFKRFGSGVVTALATEYNSQTGDFTIVPPPHESSIRGFLDNVWQSYGGFTGVKLSEMTHASDSPWAETWNKNPGVRGVDIPLPLIIRHFQAAVAKSKLATIAS